MKTSVDLGNGVTMPMVGYGMWQSDDPQQLEDALDVALDVGYRHFDTAWGYRNEKVFGKVLKRWFETGKVKRSELFITTKVPPTGNHPERAKLFLQDSLNDMGLDYVDLFLIHNPASLQTEADGMTPVKDSAGNRIPDTSATLEQTWKALEDLVANGKAKAIGLSNFSGKQVERIVKCATIKPANNQIELNAFYPRKGMRETCKRLGVPVCAFAALGSPGRKNFIGYTSTNAHLKVNIPPLLEDPVVNEIAKKHGKTSAQVLLRFLGQHDIITLAKSVTPARVKSNFDLYSFELDEEDMKKLDALDQKVENGTWEFDWINANPGIEKHPEFSAVQA